MSKILKGIQLFFSNPALFIKYLKKYFAETFFVSREKPEALPQNFRKDIGGVVFEIDYAFFPKKDPWLKQMRLGLYEIATVEYMKKVLRPGDTFIDVGAHVGYLTAMGASLVGKGGQVHSFEPVPAYFNYARKVAENNPEYRIVVNNKAIGDSFGVVNMAYTNPIHSGGSSLVPGAVGHNSIAGNIDVTVVRLDEYIRSAGLEKAALIKIDVEGYEFPVLRGLENYFQNSVHKPPIMCEITPTAYPRLGYAREQLRDYMKRYSYEAYNIMNPKKKIDITKFKEGTDVIWKAI